MWTVMTGRAAQLERRGAELDARLEQTMQQRNQVLETQAQAVCVHAQALYAIQQALEYRFQGEQLQMLELNTPAPKDDAPVSVSVVATAAH